MIKKVFLDTTNRCNAECLYCFVNAEKTKLDTELNEDQIIKIINILHENNVNAISFGGGEPFLKDMVKIINSVPSSVNLSITTNGTIINHDIIECLIKNKVKVTISLDSINEEEFNKIRKGISLKKVIENIRLISETKLVDFLSIRSTVTKYNIDNLRSLILFCDKEGIKKLKINSTNNFGRATVNQQIIPNFDNFMQKLSALRDFCFKEDFMTSVELPIDKYLKREKSICSLGKESFYINAQGYVYPCAFSEGNLNMGNILFETYNDILCNLSKFDHKNNICNKCEIHRYEQYINAK